MNAPDSAGQVEQVDEKPAADGAIEPPVHGLYERGNEPTPASTWSAASGALITDRLLEWPPDVFTLTNVVLVRAEAFGYALSAKEWPPQRFDDWAQAVIGAARHWSAWAKDRTGALPRPGRLEWRVQCQGAEVPLKQVEPGRDDQVCEALLTLHAIADEASAGRGVALDSCGADGCQYRARGARCWPVPDLWPVSTPRLLRVLPKVITPPTAAPS